MVIYIDAIFIENFILDFIILYATSLLLKSKTKILKLIIASAFGALSAIAYYFISKNIFCVIVLNVFSAIIIVYVAFGFTKLKDFFNKILMFYLTTFIFGGASSAFINIIFLNNNIKNKYSIWFIFIIFIIVLFIINMISKIKKLKINKNDLLCNITIYINGHSVKTKAMMDTGNLLKDPITNVPVIVLEHEVLKNVIPKAILNNINEILGGDLHKIPDEIQNEYNQKLKIIPFSAIGKQNGMLLGIKAETVIIEQIDKVKKVDDVIVGMYDKKIGKQNEFNALLGLELI